MKSKTLERFKEDRLVTDNTPKIALFLSELGLLEGKHLSQYMCIDYAGSNRFTATGSLYNTDYISAEDFIREVENEMNEFTKNMLENGMVMQYKKYYGKDKRIYIDGDLYDENFTISNSIEGYNNNLTKKNGDDDLDIIAIYNSDKYGKLNLIWERELEPTEAGKQLSEAKILLLKAHKAIEEAEAKIAEEKQ